jgi:hypothetical protein
MRLCTVYYISVNCSTCLGWLFHSSSGAHITVITASVTGQTVSATFRYCDALGQTSNCTTTAAGSRDGMTSYMCSWWSVESTPEICRAVYRNVINSIGSHVFGQLLTLSVHLITPRPKPEITQFHVCNQHEPRKICKLSYSGHFDSA